MVDPETDRNTLIAETLPNFHRWLHFMAYQIAPGSPDHDDLVQEGYVAMWRAIEGDVPERGPLAPWITAAARMRMQDVSYGHGQWTGHEAMRGRRPAETTSLDEILDESPEIALATADLLDGVESAYHHGEIAEAIASLSPAQREYVFLRFYLDIDPTRRDPTTRAIVGQWPVLRRRYLWTGTNHQRGARDRLAERLQHLVAA